jgi:hypothetical protein
MLEAADAGGPRGKRPECGGCRRIARAALNDFVQQRLIDDSDDGPVKTLILISAAMLAAVSPASAEDAPTERVSTLLVYGDDPCPKSTAEEVVVCARQPESERYRIPKKLRKRDYNEARDGSWAGTAKVLEMVNQQGLPNSCSPIGSYGFTGCFARFLQQNRK